jgi:hypothetical protein
MTIYKKIIIGVISLFIFVVIINIGLNYWIKKQLPDIIAHKNKTAYHITFEKMEISLFSRSIHLNTLLLHPKDQTKKDKDGLFSKIESLTIRNFSIWDLLFRDIIRANDIVITKPRAIFYKTEDKKENTETVKNKIVEPLRKIVTVSNIYLNEGSIDIITKKNNNPILRARNIIVKLEGILVTDATLKEKIPFQFSNYTLLSDSVFYRPNEFYQYNIGKLTCDKNFLKVNDFTCLPQFSRPQFISKLEKEKDIYTIKLDSATIHKMDWGFVKNRFFFNTNSITLHQADANIYRGKMPEDDLSKKYLYNHLLRNLKFPLRVDTLVVVNSKLVYEEEKEFSKGPGVLRFDRFNLIATNLKSGYGLTKTDDVQIRVRCRFMNKSPLTVNWSFNVLDKQDGFRIQGTITDFDVAAIDKFSRPYMNASFTGTFNRYSFDFYGNDNASKGNATLYYKDLKVKLYQKKNPQKEAKLKNAIVNLVVKNDSGDTSRKATVELERIKEKSFYNFLWRNIGESLKQILI